MANTMWSYAMKYPILLPRDCVFTDKLIIQAHEGDCHVGASHTLNIIRERCWMPQGKAKVTRMLGTCEQCVKCGGGPYRLPGAPPLPVEGVNCEAPCTYTGLDYFGPVFVSAPNGEHRRGCRAAARIVYQQSRKKVSNGSANETVEKGGRSAGLKKVLNISRAR